MVHVTGVSRDKLRREISIPKGEKAMRFFILLQLETAQKMFFITDSCTVERKIDFDMADFTLR